MSEDTSIQETCGSPQLLPGSEPNNEWLPEQLGTYAQAQYQQIVDNETYLSLPYSRWGTHWKSPRSRSATANGNST